MCAMWNVKDHSKLIFSTVSIVFVSCFVNFYLRKNHINESTAGVVFKYSDDIDQNWIKELHEYIAQNIDKPYSRWENTSLTTNVGHCHATCYDDRNNSEIFYGSGCQTHPVYIYDREVTDSLLSQMPYGEATTPCFLKLTKSKIPNANRGIFTTKYKIPKGVIFGPYTGVIRSAYGDEGQEARDGGYAWRIRSPYGSELNYLDDFYNLFPYINRWHEENADFYIDGVDENNSNWLRYVNTARCKRFKIQYSILYISPFVTVVSKFGILPLLDREEQNVFSLLFNDTVYYITIKDIEPETELLVWYGYKYAKWLGIFVVETSDHDWDHDYAPPVNETICPSCPMTEGVRRKEHDDEDEEAENENEENQSNEQDDNEDDEEEQPSCRNYDDDDEEMQGDIVIEDPDFELDIRTIEDEQMEKDSNKGENVIEPVDSKSEQNNVEEEAKFSP